MAVGAASAMSLFIENHSFEEDDLAFGSFYYSNSGDVPGWTTTATGGQDRGVWNTGADGKDGDNIFFAYANNSASQTLSAVALPGYTYTVTYVQGRTGGNTTGTVELYSGGEAQDGFVLGGGLLIASNTVEMSQNAMTEYSFSYTIPTTGPIVGQPLSIRLAGTTGSGSYVSFDNIRIDAVPEPATMLALGAGLAALAARRRRRS
jgi:hypothetical protein